MTGSEHDITQFRCHNPICPRMLWMSEINECATCGFEGSVQDGPIYPALEPVDDFGTDDYYIA